MWPGCKFYFTLRLGFFLPCALRPGFFLCLAPCALAFLFLCPGGRARDPGSSAAGKEKGPEGPLLYA